MPTKLLNLEPERRDAILNAALKEFVLEGYNKASTNVIAKEAGISKALIQAQRRTQDMERQQTG